MCHWHKFKNYCTDTETHTHTHTHWTNWTTKVVGKMALIILCCTLLKKQTVSMKAGGLQMMK